MEDLMPFLREKKTPVKAFKKTKKTGAGWSFLTPTIKVQAARPFGIISNSSRIDLEMKKVD
jgi:hypothetical protein